jgi:1-acyl-sn-glycerol-3-phosphate acyltransferase
VKLSEQVAGSDRTHAPDPRPAAYFTPFHERARTRKPGLTYEMLRGLMLPWVKIVLRGRAVGPECVPLHGPVIVAANHGSYLDHFILSAFVQRRLQFMAKSQMFQRPGQWVYSHAGVFPVRRGLGDQEARKTALMILARGGAVAIYGEGTRSAQTTSARPKSGVGQLALESGAPVVPIAIHGSHRIRYWKRGEFPQVTVVRGCTLRYKRTPSPSRDEQVKVAYAIYQEIARLHTQVPIEPHRR